MTQQRKKDILTWEEATLSPRGIFKVGNREFPDRDLTEQESEPVVRLVQAGEGMTNKAFICLILNKLIDKGEPEVEEEWVKAQLSLEAQGRVVTKLMVSAGLTPKE